VSLNERTADADLPEFVWTDVPAPRRSLAVRPHAEGHIPGEAGLWIFILGDMSLFGAFFIVLMWERHGQPALFAQSAGELSPTIGAINTLVLLVSSYLVVAATWAHRRGDQPLAARWLAGAAACAVVFAALKGLEYFHTLAGGNTPGSNMFFTFYFVLTGVHLLHVLIGTALLTLWARQLRRRRSWETARTVGEGVAVYWHMVDLLWIAIFTLVYLVCAL
jgi:nitric oxide reductase NorE protein